MRAFILPICISLITLPAFAQQTPFSFGVVADCQYCDYPANNVREYRDSPAKLQACVDELNQHALEFTVHLGDFIDRDWASFDIVLPIWAKLSMKSYHVLGNHDFSVADDRKALVHSKLGMPSRYYDYLVHGWRFIALDGNDISFHAAKSGSAEYAAAEAYYTDNKIDSPKWNGAISPEQLAWLKRKLDWATQRNESVVLMAHFPVYPENPHNLWNAAEVVALIEQYSCVKAYINGHNHAGNYAENNGVHYITFKGMVDTKETSFSTMTITTDELRIKGFGREEDRALVIRK